MFVVGIVFCIPRFELRDTITWLYIGFTVLHGSTSVLHPFYIGSTSVLHLSTPFYTVLHRFTGRNLYYVQKTF